MGEEEVKKAWILWETLIDLGERLWDRYEAGFLDFIMEGTMRARKEPEDACDIVHQRHGEGTKEASPHFQEGG